jgi:5-methylcytosine-specific restriction endonuclease McrA
MNFRDLNLLRFGNELCLAGAVFVDSEDTYLCMFPEQASTPNIHSLSLGMDEWKDLLRQLDLQEVEVIRTAKNGVVTKAILRKSQRLIAQRVSWAVFQRDSYRCRYCGASGVPLTVDHLILWEEGGPSVPENLLTADRVCNKARGNLPYAQWLNHPYYKKASLALTEEQRAQNQKLLETLSKIPKVKNTRSR